MSRGRRARARRRRGRRLGPAGATLAHGRAAHAPPPDLPGAADMSLHAEPEAALAAGTEPAIALSRRAERRQSPAAPRSAPPRHPDRARSSERSGCSSPPASRWPASSRCWSCSSPARRCSSAPPAPAPLMAATPARRLPPGPPTARRRRGSEASVRHDARKSRVSGASSWPGIPSWPGRPAPPPARLLMRVEVAVDPVRVDVELDRAHGAGAEERLASVAGVSCSPAAQTSPPSARCPGPTGRPPSGPGSSRPSS